MFQIPRVCAYYSDSFAASSDHILYYIMYATPSRESQVLVILGSCVVTSLDLQFSFGLASYFSNKVEIFVKEGSPQSLSVVNKH